MKEYHVFTVSFLDGSEEKFGCLKKDNHIEVSEEEAEEYLTECLIKDGHIYFTITNVSTAYAFNIGGAEND